jgi:hypothetical protein
VADGLAHGGEVSVDPLELGGDRGQREGHVAPGIAIGHRVDVEAVDAVLVRLEGVSECGDDEPEIVGTEALERGHGGAAYRLADGGDEPAGLHRATGLWSRLTAYLCSSAQSGSIGMNPEVQ